MSTLKKEDEVRISLIAPSELRSNLKLVALHLGMTSNELGVKLLNEGIQKHSKQAEVELI